VAVRSVVVPSSATTWNPAWWKREQGRPNGSSPRRTAAVVGRLFFPQSKSLGLDRSGYSPALQNKIVYAGVANTSFANASENLLQVGDVAVSAKQVERVTKGIGLERCAERDDAVALYQARSLVRRKGVPAGVTPPPVAVVGTDGGRIQILERAAAAKAATAEASCVAAAAAAATAAAAAASPPPSEAAAERGGRHWREDKIGLLMGMESDVSATDPCPRIPEGFLEPTRMGKLVRELRKGVPVAEEPADEAKDPAVEADAYASRPSVWKPPEMREKRLLGTRRNWEAFGPMVAAAAWAMGLFGSARQAFLGDGAENNWTVWRDYFSSFTPILDFIHALSYVYAAAHAGRTKTAGWLRYRAWIAWVWQGRVDRVLEALRALQAEWGEPKEEDKETHPRRVVATTLTYLENNRSRMRYDAYRRQGLPITSSYVESAVKQFNRRAKGTEKFWTEEGAEAILQLRGDYLSANEPLEAFWERRQAQTSGQRPYRRVAA
jgi:hypothetical protein